MFVCSIWFCRINAGVCFHHYVQALRTLPYFHGCSNYAWIQHKMFQCSTIDGGEVRISQLFFLNITSICCLEYHSIVRWGVTSHWTTICVCQTWIHHLLIGLQRKHRSKVKTVKLNPKLQVQTCFFFSSFLFCCFFLIIIISQSANSQVGLSSS